MKIVYVHGVPMPSMQANTVHVMKMCSALAKNGHKVELFIPDEGSSEDDLFEYYGVEPDFKVKRIFRPKPGWGRRVFSYFAGLFSYFRRPDIVFTRCVLTANVTTFLNIPTILEIHVPPDLMGPTTSKAFYQLVGRPACKRIVVISEALNKIVSSQVCRSDIDYKLYVAHDGADICSLDEPEDHSSEGFSVAYAGHLYEGRGIDVIVGVAKKLGHVHFDIYGGAEEYVKKWSEFAAVEGVDNILFHGHLPPAKVADQLSMANVLLAPYQEKVQAAGGLSDTSKWMSPLKIFEYMAAKKAIVSSDLPVLREVLTDGKNSILCAPNDINEWVEAISRLESSESLRNSLGETGFSTLKQKYAWTVRAENIVSIS